MPFNPVTAEAISKLSKIVGKEFVLADESSRESHGHDETEDLNFPPEAVVVPASAAEVASVLALCNELNIPVTPRGAGTGLSGGSLPVYGGISLSTARLNRILEIDERNLQATAEPGVITQVFQDAVKDKGLFYPPDPASRGSCFLGGNVAENSGGPKAVKYGVVKDYVLNLEVALASGELIWTGANVLKNATGYNLTQLMVGSEGTLGVVTKIVLRLIPHPKHDMLMLVPFRFAAQACEAVSAIFIEGITPSGLEFMERDAIVLAARFTGSTSLLPAEDIQAHLLIEVDGNDPAALMDDCEKIIHVLEKFDCGEILFADNARQKEELWQLRRKIAEAVKAASVYKEEDAVVPRAELAKLLEGVKKTGLRYGFKSVCYGHAGDGNLHINIMKGNMSDEDWNGKLPEGIREIFRLCHSLGGTISGEHGIGFVQKQYMDVVFRPEAITIMQNIKKVFDPKGILNPGKIFMR